jgi:hypothetical protein
VTVQSRSIGIAKPGITNQGRLEPGGPPTMTIEHGPTVPGTVRTRRVLALSGGATAVAGGVGWALITRRPDVVNTSWLVEVAGVEALFACAMLLLSGTSRALRPWRVPAVVFALSSGATAIGGLLIPSELAYLGLMSAGFGFYGLVIGQFIAATMALTASGRYRIVGGLLLMGAVSLVAAAVAHIYALQVVFGATWVLTSFTAIQAVGGSGSISTSA